MSQDWFFDLPPSPINSPSPRRKGYASPIFAIVPDHKEDTCTRLRDRSSPIVSRTVSPARRDVAVRSPLASCSISRTSSASTPSLMRSCSPAGQTTARTPGMGQRSRSAFGRSINDLWPTEPRSRSQSAASPLPPARPASPIRSPSQRRELAREIVQQVKNSGVRAIPLLITDQKTANTQRALNKSKSEMMVSRLPRREESASISSTTTTTRTGGKTGIVSKSVSTTSVTISKNIKSAGKSPPPVIDRSSTTAKSPILNGRQGSCSPIRKAEGTLSRSKVQLLTNHREEEEDEVERRQRLLQERKSRTSPIPGGKKVREKSPDRSMQKQRENVKKVKTMTPAIIVSNTERVRKEGPPVAQPQHAAGLESRTSRERIAARMDLESTMRRDVRRQESSSRPSSSAAAIVEKERRVLPQRKVLLLFWYLVIVLLLLFPCCPIRMIHLMMLDCGIHATADDCLSMMHSAYSCPV